MTVRDTVFQIIAEQAVLDISDVTAESTLDDLGIDSMGVVEAIFAIEEAFDITVPFNANAPEDSEFDISNVGNIATAVERLVTSKS